MLQSAQNDAELGSGADGRKRRGIFKRCACPPHTSTLDHARHAMRLQTGTPPYLERFFARLFAAFGGLLFVAGLILLIYQVYLYVDLGVWGRLPASSLFVEAKYPVDVEQVSKDVEKLRSATSAPAQRQLPASVREMLVYEKLDSAVPNWFRSKTSWLADPDRLYGLHNVVSWLLNFLSIPVFLFLVGATILALSLRDLPRNVEPTGREHAT